MNDLKVKVNVSGYKTEFVNKEEVKQETKKEEKK
jgi:hypothetical protein